jgi:hypothetical protein
MADPEKTLEELPMVPCQQCGCCCEMLVGEGALVASEEDLQRWEAQGRGRIFELELLGKMECHL